MIKNVFGFMVKIVNDSKVKILVAIMLLISKTNINVNFYNVQNNIRFNKSSRIQLKTSRRNAL